MFRSAENIPKIAIPLVDHFNHYVFTNALAPANIFLYADLTSRFLLHLIFVEFYMDLMKIAVPFIHFAEMFQFLLNLNIQHSKQNIQLFKFYLFHGFL